MILELAAQAEASGATLAGICNVLGLSERTMTRWRDRGAQQEDGRRGPRTTPAHALTASERREVIEVATCPEYRELSPKQLVPRLADKGVYLASESTFYRILRAEQLLAHREPSRPRTHQRPNEYVATQPGQVWTWDITYLRSPVRGTFYYLYLALDIFSRKIVAAEVHEQESATVAGEVIQRACERENVDASKLTLHADNGAPMKGSTMLAMLQRLGVVTSFSRPSVSDDNPYVEALFRTLKFRPGYPRKPFASALAAAQWVEAFVAWYNGEHLHSAIGYVTPATRHQRKDYSVLAARHALYQRARNHAPRRWTGATRNWSPLGAVVLNPAKAAVIACVMHQ